MRNKNKLVYNFGINDVDNPVTVNKTVDGKRKQVYICPYYCDWRDMIFRATSQKFKNARPTYQDCTICEEWKYFSNFIKWVDSQPNRDWQNCALDKDLLCTDNKIYSPDTCVYVDTVLNSFMTLRNNDRGSYMVGVSLDKESGKYKAECSNPLNPNIKRYIGRYTTEIEAHKAWQQRKHEYACMLADLQNDTRVAEALRNKFSLDKDLSKI